MGYAGKFYARERAGILGAPRLQRQRKRMEKRPIPKMKNRVAFCPS
jgi:hypothetical protein